MKSFQGKKGFTLIEMIIYLSVLAVFSVIIVDAMVNFSVSYKKLKVARIIANSAAVSLERIGREIRQADNVDLGQSVLNSNPGSIRLNTSNVDGYIQAVSFKLEEGIVNIYENDLYAGRLTPLEASTTNLVFRLIETGFSQAVKVEMTIQTGVDSDLRSENFYITSQLRNSI